MSEILNVTEWTAEKLRWQLRLLCDTTLSTRARLLGALLMHDFEYRRGGYAWRGQLGSDGLAARTGWGVRNLQLAAGELENSGYLTIERGKGRGHSNRYWPNFEKTNADAPFHPEGRTSVRPSAPEKAKVGSPFESEKANNPGGKGERQFAQLHEYSGTTPLPPSVAAEGAVGLAGSARTACALDRLVTFAEADDQAREIWASATAAMRQRLPSSTYDAWVERAYLGSCGQQLYVVAWSSAGVDWFCRDGRRVFREAWVAADPLKRELPVISRADFERLPAVRRARHAG